MVTKNQPFVYIKNNILHINKLCHRLASSQFSRLPIWITKRVLRPVAGYKLKINVKNQE